MKTTYIAGTVIEPEWLNEVNTAVFDAIGNGTDAPTTAAEVKTNLGLSAAVIGPASATDGGFAKFDGLTGKLLKNSAATIAIADGGTGATSESAARSALDVPSNAEAVLVTGDQTVAGIKTFSSLPVLPASTPTGLQAASAFAAFRKNAIINGDFQVWQEGTSFAAMADSTYIADNWKYVKSGAMVHTGSRSTDVPTVAQAGRKILYSMLIDCTTVDAAIAAGDFAAVSTFIEGYNFVNIAGVGLCCQFWHKHTKTGTYCVSFVNSGNDRSFIREYTQAISDTWELATVLVDASPTAGTWDYTNGVGLKAFFTLASGTTYQGAAGSWNSALHFATASQVNACDNVANNFMLAGVQLEKGSVATEFDVRSFQQELAACERYFEKSYNTTSADSAGVSLWIAAFNGSATWTADRYRVTKRTTPTVTLYSYTSSAAGFIRDFTAPGDVAASATNIGVTGHSVNFTAVINRGYGWHFTASARF